MHAALNLILLLDTLSFVIGVVIFVLAVYAIAAYGFFAILFPISFAYISIAVGAVLMALGLFGCWSARLAKRGTKCFLLCYIMLVVACLGAQIAALALITQVDGLVSTQDELVSGSLTSPAQIDLNNALLSTYVACCYGCPLGECNNAESYYEDKALPNCFPLGVVPVCLPVPVIPCLTANQTGCIVSSDLVGGKFPPVRVEAGVCAELAKMSYPSSDSNASKLVGMSSSGGCGGGSPSQFSTNVIKLFASQLPNVQLAFGVLIGVQALNLLTSIFVCRNEGREFDRGAMVQRM